MKTPVKKDHVQENKPHSEPIIDLSQVRVELGKYIALEGIDFKLPTGSFLTILGPNGAGKTLLLKLLLGLVSAQAGKVAISGKTPQNLPAKWIGYVPQIKTLNRTFPAQAIELVASGIRGNWPGRLSAQEHSDALATLDTVHAKHLATRELNSLSGGELQRIYLARSLARQPRLVLLDEPATGIDAHGEADFLTVLEKFRKEAQTTIVMVTHDRDVAYHHSTHVLVLNKCQLAYGTPLATMTEKNLFLAFGHVRHHHPVGPAVPGRERKKIKSPP